MSPPPLAPRLVWFGMMSHQRSLLPLIKPLVLSASAHTYVKVIETVRGHVVRFTRPFIPDPGYRAKLDILSEDAVRGTVCSKLSSHRVTLPFCAEQSIM